MLNRNTMKPLVIEALRASKGTARMRDVAKYLWENYQSEIEASGEFLYVWQYELRWTGEALVREGRIAKGPPVGTWHLRPESPGCTTG